MTQQYTFRVKGQARKPGEETPKDPNEYNEDGTLKCVHHWLIESSQKVHAGRWPGQCKKCGARKIFGEKEEDQPHAYAPRRGRPGRPAKIPRDQADEPFD